MKHGWLSLVGLALIGLGCGGPAAPQGDALVRPVTAAELKGLVRDSGAAVVVVNLWATWCGPCREEFPALLRLRREWGGRGVRLLLVSTDLASEFPAVKQFLAEQRVDFPTYWKAEPDAAFIAGLGLTEWAGALPATVVYDAQGRVRDFWQGLADYPRLTNAVGRVLDQP